MSKILALDTSTDACSVALLLNGEVQEDFRVIPRQHTKQLLPMVEALLASAEISVSQLDAIAFGRGPGSFAGIRIATGVTQGLAFAADLPVLPVSTLEALALSAYRLEKADRVVAALDARMDEIYVATYHMIDDMPQAIGVEQVCSPSSFALEGEETYLGVGSGWRYLEDMHGEVQQRLQVSADTYYPSAANILAIAERDFNQGITVAAEDALPVYLRDHVAWKKKDQQ